MEKKRSLQEKELEKCSKERELLEDEWWATVNRGNLGHLTLQ